MYQRLTDQQCSKTWIPSPTTCALPPSSSLHPVVFCGTPTSGQIVLLREMTVPYIGILSYHHLQLWLYISISGWLTFFPLPLSCCMFLLYQIMLGKKQNSPQHSYPFFNTNQIFSRNFVWQTVSDFSCHRLSWHAHCFHQALFPSWCYRPVLVRVYCQL